MKVFIDWCSAGLFNWLSATPTVLAEFIDAQANEHCISTIKRRLCAIAFAHRLNDLPTPADCYVVQLALRRATRLKARRPEQVRGLNKNILAMIVVPVRLLSQDYVTRR